MTQQGDRTESRKPADPASDLAEATAPSPDDILHGLIREHLIDTDDPHSFLRDLRDEKVVGQVTRIVSALAGALREKDYLKKYYTADEQGRIKEIIVYAFNKLFSSIDDLHMRSTCLIALLTALRDESIDEGHKHDMLRIFTREKTTEAVFYLEAISNIHGADMAGELKDAIRRTIRTLKDLTEEEGPSLERYFHSLKGFHPENLLLRIDQVDDLFHAQMTFSYLGGPLHFRLTATSLDELETVLLQPLASIAAENGINILVEGLEPLKDRVSSKISAFQNHP